MLLVLAAVGSPGIHNLATIWFSGLTGLIWCISRESTQYEYQYIQTHGGRRALMPKMTGLKVWDWNTHSIRETAIAALFTLGLSTLLTYVLVIR